MIERFLIIPDPQERLSALVSRAAKADRFDNSERIEANLVPGCVSQVWLIGSKNADVCHFRSDADSPLVAGLVALLCEVCDSATARELTGFTPVILDELGIWKNLSPTRQNGLRAVQKTIQQFAKSCL